MKLKKWLAVILSSGTIGIACGTGVIGLIVAGVTGYNILMQEDDIEGEEEDLAKVHRLGYGECECNCVYIGEGGDINGSSGDSSGGGTGSSSGPIEFTGTEDKSDPVNSIFYLNKLICDELGVPLWLPYAKNSGELGGCIYGNRWWAMKWDKEYIGLDANVLQGVGSQGSRDVSVRSSMTDGACGFFQVEGISVEDEMGYIQKDLSRYTSLLEKAGLDVSKYPGMQAGLIKELAIGWTNWYQDCTYYPAAVINAMESCKESKDSVDKLNWLQNYEWYNSATQEEKDLVCYYVALTLWNNGKECAEMYYSKNDLYAKYLEAFLDITRNKYDDFINQQFKGTSGNGNNYSYDDYINKRGKKMSGAKESLYAVYWVLDNSSVITPEIRAQFEAEFRKDGGGNYKKVLLRRFCAYSTNELYNTMTPTGDVSVTYNLAQHGINITGGWRLLSGGKVSTGGSNKGTVAGAAQNAATNMLNNFNKDKESNEEDKEDEENTKTDSTKGTPLGNSEKKINTTKNNSDKNTGGTGNLGNSGSDGTLGKLVEDATASPDGLPLYDNYTFNENKYEYWDTNYEQFWDGTTPSTSPLYQLGDWVNNAGVNYVTQEGPIRLPTSQITKVANASIYDGRIAFAIPTRVFQKPGENLDKFLALSKDPDQYTGKDGKVDLPTLPENGLLNSAAGLYFDIVLDNGTVIPGIAGDAKGLHNGIAKDGNYPGYYFGGTDCDGYAHIIYHANGSKKGALWSLCILENCGGGGNSAVKRMLMGHKISSIRTYNIYSNEASGYTKYFTQGGSDSSFGLTGGSTTGNAAVGGTGGGSTTVTTGLNPKDPNWKCDCDIPCSKCMCHDNGVGGRPVGSDGSTDENGGGGSSSVSASMQATPGLPQGIYCDLNGNQLTPEQVWAMFTELNPSIATLYAPGIGIEPLWDITECDPLLEKFNDTKGIIHYKQGGGNPWATQNMKLHERFGDGFSQYSACFKDSGCGWTACSIIASSLLHRYITPPEVVMASYLSPKLNAECKTSFLAMFAWGDAGAQVHTNNDDFWNTLRYKGEKLFTISHSEAIDKATLDQTLDAGGMAIMCITQCRWRESPTSGGHYIVIRSKDKDAAGKDRYYTADGSHERGTSGDGNVPSYFEVVSAAGKRKYTSDQVTYVVPGPGYQAYIDSLKTGSSNGNTGSTGNLGDGTLNMDDITVTEHMLSNNSRHLDDIWRDESGNIPQDAKVYVFTPKNTNGHSVTIDAGHGNNSHPATSLPTEKVFPGLSDAQISGMNSQELGNSKGVEVRAFKNVFDNKEIEPECTLAVAIKVRDKLLAQGYTVTMTRNTSSQNLSNGTRSVLGCETSEIYVAIHTNGSDSHTARGVISYYPDDSNNGGGYRNGYTRMLGLDANKAESKRLAQELSTGVKNATTGLPFNGSGTSGHVLRIFSYSNKPIALVELAFSDQYDDAKVLIEQKDEMAQGIVDGINSYFGIR